MRKFTVEPMRTGLNNQRMCLLGLICLAEDQSGEAIIPASLIDYAPAPKEGKGLVPMDPVSTWEVFDRDAFVTHVHGRPVALDGIADETLPMQECFTRGAAALRAQDHSTAAFLRATAPAPALANHAAAIVSWLAGFGPFTALQLRIERDWSDYLIRKFGADDVITEAEHLTVDPVTILGRLADTPELPRTIWACCDEDDLLEPIGDLKGLAREMDLRLLFKPDLPERLAYPKRRLLRSAIDFAVALGAPHYVGLTRSTFSNTVELHRRLGLTSTSVYAYNVPGETVQKRAA